MSEEFPLVSTNNNGLENSKPSSAYLVTLEFVIPVDYCDF